MDRRNFWVRRQTDELLDYAERIHRSFTQSFTASFPGRDSVRAQLQPVNVVECDDVVWVISALPGVAVDDLDISLQGNELIINGRRRIPDCCREGELRIWEIPFGRFERRLRFVDQDTLSIGETRLDRGLLFIQLMRNK